MAIVDRYVVSVPADAAEWVAQLDALARQIRGRRVDPAKLRVGLDAVEAAIVDHQPW